LGSLGTKISLIRVKNVLDDSTKPEGTFHEEVNALLDKFYTDFSGHLIDHCFSNMVLNRHHRKSDNDDQMKNLKSKEFHTILFESSKAKEILSVNKSSKVHIENYFQELPLSVKVEKEDFENTCDEIYSKLTTILKDFDQIRGENKIDKIEVIGGVVRTPKILELLQEYYKMEIG